MTGIELRTRVRAFSHGDLVAVLVALCSGMYPRIARDSVLAELARRGAPKPPPVLAGQVPLFDLDGVAAGPGR